MSGRIRDRPQGVVDSVNDVPDPLRPLRLNALELMREPGNVREIREEFPAADLEAVHPTGTGDVTVDYTVESIDDGVVVRGTIAAPWAGHCRRCLRDLSGTAVVEVDELYQREMSDDDAFPIENNQLDLAPVTRETVLLALEDERLCRDDCAGLCPACGVDRNDAICSCDTDVFDERWAVLDDLRLDD